MKHYSRSEIADKFRQYIRMNYPTQTEAADYYNVTPQYLSNVVRGKTVPNKSMLDDLGFEGRTVFTKIKHKSCDIE